MPECEFDHLVTDFSQIFYPPVFEKIKNENREYDLWVCLILNNLLAL